MSETKQVGGDHYKASQQHWDLMEEYDISYLEATASKYVVRWRKKDGVKDLRKSVSYIDRTLEEGRAARRLIPSDVLDRFASEYDLPEAEKSVLVLLHVVGTIEALRSARALLLTMASLEEAEEKLRAPRVAAA